MNACSESEAVLALPVIAQFQRLPAHFVRRPLWHLRGSVWTRGRETRRDAATGVRYAGQVPSFRRVWSNASKAFSRSACVWAAEIWQRMRALSFGTTG